MAEPAPAEGKGISKGFAIAIAVILLLVGIGAGWVLSGALVAPEAPPASTIEKIYRTGVMVVGTDASFPPFENVNPTTGEIEGFDIDLINEIAAFMGVRADVRNTGWDPLFTAIPARTLDLAISAMTINAERNLTLLFSDPYFFSDLTIIVKKGSPNEQAIGQPADLEGKKIAFQRETTSDDWVTDILVGQLGVTPADIRRTELFTDAVALLVAGEVDAVIIDKPVAEGYQAAGQVTIVYTIVTNEAFGIPMPPGEFALKAVINAALKDIRDSGKYDELIQKWFVA